MCSLEAETTGGEKNRSEGQNTCGKRAQTVAELGTCGSNRQDALCTEEPMFLRLRREINRVVHSSMTTPDIEVEIVKRTLNTCCTVQQSKTRTLRLLAEMLALVEKKQRFLQRWRGARRLCEKEQLSGQCKSQTPVVKGAVRAYKRRKLEELAGEVDMQSPAAKQEQRMQWSNDKLQSKHRPELQCDRRMDHQRGAMMVSSERAEMHLVLFLEQCHFPTPRRGHRLTHLLNTKPKMHSGQSRSCQMEKLVCAFGVEARSGCRAVESSGWTACAGSTITGHRCSMDRDSGHRLCSTRK